MLTQVKEKTKDLPSKSATINELTLRLIISKRRVSPSVQLTLLPTKTASLPSPTEYCKPSLPYIGLSYVRSSPHQNLDENYRKIYKSFVSFRPDYFTPFTRAFYEVPFAYSNKTRLKPVPRTNRNLGIFSTNRETGEAKEATSNHDGTLSRNSRTKLKNALYLLKLISKPKYVYSQSKKKGYKFKLSFITLTVPSPQLQDDKIIVSRLLDNFLQYCKRFHEMNSYVWKAETQKNGALHFHITTNVFIHWAVIAKKWDSLLSIHGYYAHLPNIPTPKESASTSVKAVINEGEIVNYLSNYILKKQLDRRQVTCRIWSCSRNLVNKKFSISCDDSIDWQLNETKILTAFTHKIVKPHFRVYYHKQSAWKLRGKSIMAEYKKMIRNVCELEALTMEYIID